MPLYATFKALGETWLKIRQDLEDGAALPVETKLFWRPEDRPFEEASSSKIQAVASGVRRAVALTIGAGNAPAELRIDVADQPGLLRIFGLELFDSRGCSLHCWDLMDAGAIRAHGVVFFPAGDGQPGNVAVLQRNPVLLISIPGHARARLAAGGSLKLDFRWMDWEEHARTMEKSAQELLGAAGELREALSGAEELAAVRGRQLQLQSEQLESMRRAIAAYKQKTEDDARRLAETELALGQTGKEAANWRAAAEQIERSLSWRWTAPVRAMIRLFRK